MSYRTINFPICMNPLSLVESSQKVILQHCAYFPDIWNSVQPAFYKHLVIPCDLFFFLCHMSYISVLFVFVTAFTFPLDNLKFVRHFFVCNHDIFTSSSFLVFVFDFLSTLSRFATSSWSSEVLAAFINLRYLLFVYRIVFSANILYSWGFYFVLAGSSKDFRWTGHDALDSTKELVALSILVHASGLSCIARDPIISSLSVPFVPFLIRVPVILPLMPFHFTSTQRYLSLSVVCTCVWTKLYLCALLRLV